MKWCWSPRILVERRRWCYMFVQDLYPCWESKSVAIFHCLHNFLLLTSHEKSQKILRKGVLFFGFFLEKIQLSFLRYKIIKKIINIVPRVLLAIMGCCFHISDSNFTLLPRKKTKFSKGCFSATHPYHIKKCADSKKTFLPLQ